MRVLKIVVLALLSVAVRSDMSAIFESVLEKFPHDQRCYAQKHLIETLCSQINFLALQNGISHQNQETNRPFSQPSGIVVGEACYVEKIMIHALSSEVKWLAESQKKKADSTLLSKNMSEHIAKMFNPH